MNIHLEFAVKLYLFANQERKKMAKLKYFTYPAFGFWRR